MKLSEHFDSVEFDCKCRCGGGKDISPKLISGLEKLRLRASQFAKQDCPLVINSGYRCEPHNATIPGASPSSPHITKEAADVRASDKLASIITPEVLFSLAEFVPEFKSGGIGIYNGRIHVDVSRKPNRPARWDKRKF